MNFMSYQQSSFSFIQIRGGAELVHLGFDGTVNVSENVTINRKWRTFKLLLSIRWNIYLIKHNIFVKNTQGATTDVGGTHF